MATSGSFYYSLCFTGFPTLVCITSISVVLNILSDVHENVSEYNIIHRLSSFSIELALRGFRFHSNKKRILDFTDNSIYNLHNVKLRFLAHL